MASDPIRDQKNDYLLTPENAALVIIDYQPVQVSSIRSMDSDQMVKNMKNLARIAKLYNLPIVLSTVNVSTGANKPTIDALTEVLGDDVVAIDRTSINSWEDKDFRAAVEATGRKKILMTALWTEACLSLPSLDMLHEGYEVYPVADALGGTSKEAHDIALRRLEAAGAQTVGWVQVACELQRDWNREETSKEFANILFGDEGIFA